MLEHLAVHNLGVLEEASIDPSGGFTVITGETGAGKTLLLGGLRLVLGGKAEATSVGPHGDIAQVQGLFALDNEAVGATRTVPRNGRSRAHIEGAIVSADALADRLGGFVEVVGQNDQLAITRPSHLLALIDDAMGEEKLAVFRGAYRAAWRALQDALARQQRLGGDQIALVRELDLARYQAGEIAGAGLSPGLDEGLESSVSRLRNIEEIREHLLETVRIAETMSEMAGELVSRLRKAAELDPGCVPLAGEAEGLAGAVSELGRESRSSVETMDADPAGLEELEQRLTALGDLKRKYGRTLDEVIAYGQQAARRVEELESLIGDAERTESVIEAAHDALAVKAKALSGARLASADAVSGRVLEHLADLGLASARVEIEVETVDPGPSGADRVTMRFAADSRLEPGDVATVASGGELSRLVLALRLATRSVAASTLVFDEVDTGIGGKTALAMGEKLAQLASVGQVLCVTHLPQVAAYADTHYVVERGPDGTGVVRLVAGEDRVTEITRMLAGLPDSAAGRSAAAELLAGAAK